MSVDNNQYFRRCVMAGIKTPPECSRAASLFSVAVRYHPAKYRIER
jgi:hypothetical protein